jgi:5-methylcytosine-specific restriction enzyme subunit McrC
MPEVITLFEHEQVEFPWTDRDLIALERLNQNNGVAILRATLRGGQHCLRASEYVGLIQFRNYRVQVLPKIYQSSITGSTDQVRQATANLLYLLSLAGQLPIKEQAIQRLIGRDLDWFEILTRLFANHLIEEWQRGAHRNYQVIEDELPVLKGKWRMAAQLGRPACHHRFAVAYDEFSADVPMNRLLRYVVERLWNLTRNSENHRLLSMARQWMEGIFLPTVFSLDQAECIQLNRLNRRYEPLLTLAKLFLLGSVPELDSGDRQSFAFVFDMNALYEAFVVNFLRKFRDALPDGLKHCELLPQTRGASRHLALHHKRRTFRLRPDLAFKQGDSFPLLLDTKYKRLSAKETHLGVATSDFYQMYVYARRYDCPQVLLLYPQTIDMDAPIRGRYELEDFPGHIRVETLDLRTDLSNWQNRKNLIEQFQTILEG